MTERYILKLVPKTKPTGQSEDWPVELSSEVASQLAACRGVRAKTELLSPWIPETHFMVAVYREGQDDRPYMRSTS